MFATCSWLGCSKSRKISERFLTKWHGDIATRGASRTFGEGLGRSTVAHFARKVRGSEYCGGQARAKNPTKICPRALAIFATCSWPSLCKQSELQCWRRNRRLCGPAQISAARALLPLSQPLFFPLPQKTKNPATHMWGHGVAGLFMIVCQNARSVALATGRAAGCQSAMSENSAPEAKSCPVCSLTARKRM